MAWIKKWWWTILIAGAAVLSVVLWLIFRGKKKPVENNVSFSTKAKEEISKAEVDALISKEKAKSKSETDMGKLKEIEKIEDGVKRRVELANYLDGLL